MLLGGIETAQMSNQIDLFDELIERFSICTVIELGLYKGGLANYLIKKQSDTFHYYGFEFVEADLDGKVVGRPEITIADASATGTMRQIQGIIGLSGSPLLIFCDTFDKPREMNNYSQLLRVGDFIQGHDYPGEGVDDKFLSEFGDEHTDLEELEPDRIRKEIGTTVWRKIR